MKHKIITLAITSFIISIALVGCNSSAKKVENAEENREAAREDLAEANEAYLLEVEAFRKESADKIAENERSIAEFNARLVNEKAEAKAAYQKEIDELNRKNSDLKKKLDDYKANGKDQWNSFKNEFSRDMDDLGKSLRDFTNKDN